MNPTKNMPGLKGRTIESMLENLSLLIKLDKKKIEKYKELIYIQIRFQPTLYYKDYKTEYMNKKNQVAAEVQRCSQHGLGNNT